MSSENYLIVNCYNGTEFVKNKKYKIMAKFKGEEKKSHFIKSKEDYSFDCGFCFNCSLNEYQTEPLELFIMTNKGLGNKPKAVAKYTFPNKTITKKLWGPYTVPFTDLVTEEVFCKVSMQIQYIEFADTLSVPDSFDPATEEPLYLSINIESADLYSSRLSMKGVYCELYNGNTSIGKTEKSFQTEEWNRRLLIDCHQINPNKSLCLALYYGRDYYIGECDMSWSDLAHPEAVSYELTMKGKGCKQSILVISAQVIYNTTTVDNPDLSISQSIDVAEETQEEVQPTEVAIPEPDTVPIDIVGIPGMGVMNAVPETVAPENILPVQEARPESLSARLETFPTLSAVAPVPAVVLPEAAAPQVIIDNGMGEAQPVPVSFDPVIPEPVLFAPTPISAPSGSTNPLNPYSTSAYSLNAQPIPTLPEPLPAPAAPAAPVYMQTYAAMSTAVKPQRVSYASTTATPQPVPANPVAPPQTFATTGFAVNPSIGTSYAIDNINFDGVFDDNDIPLSVVHEPNPPPTLESNQPEPVIYDTTNAVTPVIPTLPEGVTILNADAYNNYEPIPVNPEYPSVINRAAMEEDTPQPNYPSAIRMEPRLHPEETTVPETNELHPTIISSSYYDNAPIVVEPTPAAPVLPSVPETAPGGVTYADIMEGIDFGQLQMEMMDI